MSDTVQKIHNIFGVNEAIDLPNKMMEVLFDKEQRETAMKRYLDEYTPVLSFDGFHDYYEQEQAERKTNKQDYTPDSVAKVMTGILGSSSTDFEIAAGTGGIVIQKWWKDMGENPYNLFVKLPSRNFYQMEELSGRAIPFLLFNLIIRGMNAVVVHGDSLEQTAKGVFFIQNDDNTYLRFSSLNVMPYTDTVKKEFGIKEWSEQLYPAHIESEKPEWMKYYENKG